jgi:hypothetical protein
MDLLWEGEQVVLVWPVAMLLLACACASELDAKSEGEPEELAHWSGQEPELEVEPV